MHKSIDDNIKLQNEIKSQTNDALNRTIIDGESQFVVERDLYKGIKTSTNSVDYQKNINDLSVDVTNEWDSIYSTIRNTDVVLDAEIENIFYKTMINDTAKIYSQLPAQSVNNYRILNEVAQQHILDGTLTQNEAVSIVTKNYKGAHVTYSNGAKMPFDKYLEMNYRTNSMLIAKQRAMQIGNDIGTDIYEYSSHANPRIDCSEIEGELISTGNSTSTTDMLDNKYNVIPLTSTSYGDAGGVLGVNCTHMMFPFVPGVSSKADWGKQKTLGDIL